MIITSLENKEVKYLTKLNQKKYMEQEHKFLIEGYHLIEEAEKVNLLEKIIILEGVSYSTKLPTITVTKEVMKKISMMESIPDIMGLCHMSSDQKIGNHVLMLDGIQDPGNLGTIIRSAAAFNVDTIILSLDTVDLYNAKVIRSTQGMLFHISIIRKNLEKELFKLRENGYYIYTTNVLDGTSVKNIKVPSKYVLIVGNEGNGVKEEISALADQTLYIPMSNQVESLNVGVAASIILYEMEN